MMKIINKICQILAIVFGLGSLVLFFTNFATITTGGTPVDVIGAVLGFGGEVEANGATYDMAKSADIWFCFWLTAIAFALSIATLKSNKCRYFAPAFGLGSAIYMLVIALSDAVKFVDTRPLPTVSAIEYAPFVLIAAIALFVFSAFGIAHLLIADYIEVKESKGERLTIPKRIVRFLRDYKSEVKKIVWPGPRDVVKNTVIVLIMCLIVGSFIWLIDLGLGQLLKLILGA